MAYGNDLVIAECEACGQRRTVGEGKWKDGTVKRLCEQCIGPPYRKMVACRQALEERDKQVEGDKPHKPHLYTQTH